MSNEPKTQLLFYQAPDGRTRLEVRMQGETVWLTQAQMAELFQTTQQNVSLHIQNIYDEGELTPAATHKESLSVQLRCGAALTPTASRPRTAPSPKKLDVSYGYPKWVASNPIRV